MSTKFYGKEGTMKRLSLFVSILTTLIVFPGPGSAQTDDIRSLFFEQVAQSGCCKVRKSAQHPWSKTGRNLSQCEAMNQSDGDSVYNSSGKIWWDRAC